MEKINSQINRVKYDNLEYPVSVTYTDLAGINKSDTGWAWHEDLKLIIIDHGSAQINSDDESLRLLPGQAVLIGRNVMHSISQFGDQGCSYYAITFHPSFVLGKDSDYFDSLYTNFIRNRTVRFIIFDESVAWHSELLEYLNSVIITNMLKVTAYEVKTRGYLCLFWSVLIEHLSEDSDELSDTSSSLDEERVKSAMSFIRTHHAEKITLEEIAEYIHLSKSECCRCFKRSVSMTPFEYLMKYRVYEASMRLRDPAYVNYSIADIAYEVGFNNLSYFSKQFGKYMSCTPRQYRSSTKNHNTSINLMML